MVDNRMTAARYAKHRGVSRQAVATAIQRGRLHESIVLVDGRTMIDAGRADAEWSARAGKRTTGRPTPADPFAAEPAKCAPAETAEVYQLGGRVVVKIVVPGDGNAEDGDRHHGVPFPDAYLASARAVDAPSTGDDPNWVMDPQTARQLAEALAAAVKENS